MGSLRFTDSQTRPTEGLDWTGLSGDEFQHVVLPFEAAFQAHMAQWRLDGRPRTARQYPPDQNCPLPTPEDRLWLILVYLKTYPLQVVPGRRFGMGQSTAQQWIHVLWVVLRSTLRLLGEAPTRSVTERATRRGVAEVEATAWVAPTPAPSTPGAPPASPLVATTAPNGASRVPRSRRSRRAVIAARRTARRCRMCC
jgi:hypothetical protein